MIMIRQFLSNAFLEFPLMPLVLKAKKEFEHSVTQRTGYIPTCPVLCCIIIFFTTKKQG